MGFGCSFFLNKAMWSSFPGPWPKAGSKRGGGDLGPQSSCSQVVFQRNLVSHGGHCGKVSLAFSASSWDRPWSTPPFPEQSSLPISTSGRIYLSWQELNIGIKFATVATWVNCPYLGMLIRQSLSIQQCHTPMIRIPMDSHNGMETIPRTPCFDLGTHANMTIVLLLLLASHIRQVIYGQ